MALSADAGSEKLEAQSVASVLTMFSGRFAQTRKVWCIVIGFLVLFQLRAALSDERKVVPQVAVSGIRLNTIGFAPQAHKIATIAGGGDEFVVRDARTGEDVFRGQLLRLETSTAYGEPLSIADFSAVTREGEYLLEVSGTDMSRDVRVANNLLNWPFYCIVRAMYLWRCGTAVTGEFGGNTFHHDACHLDDAYLDHAGGPAQRRDGVGGWHDAGDYNKYTVNAAFTAGMMLKAWEHFRDQLSTIAFDIPESGNDVPDFLDEVRWELDWLMKMQVDDGRVYHKLSTLKFGDFIPPEEEKTRRFFSSWSSSATADLAAVMAQAARIYRPVDESFAKHCLDMAETSYQFLRDNPDDHGPNQSAFSTGPYDSPDGDDRLWAAAEIWETTGKPQYLRDLENMLRAGAASVNAPTSAIDADWDWSNLRNLGTLTYLMSGRSGRDSELVAKICGDALKTADQIVASARNHPYGRPLGSKYYWGCNGTVARQTMNLQVAYRLTGEPRYRTAMLDAINHLFGRNPFGRSYVTGLGAQPPRFPHDRRSGGDKVTAPWPGYLVGGPWPKETDWYDIEEDYRTNEIAINWNGALIYALAAFVEPREFEASVATGQREANNELLSK